MLILSFKLYKTSRQNERLKDKLSLENTIHQNEISEILKRYDSLKGVSVLDSASSDREKISVKSKAKPVVTASTTIQRNADLTRPLKAVNVNVRGVRLLGKDVLETNHSTNIDQIRVCFTLESNKDVMAGQKQISLQILNPKNRIINLKKHPENKLHKILHYDRLDVDACMFVNLYQHELIAGDYKIKLICDNKSIGSTVLKVN